MGWFDRWTTGVDLDAEEKRAKDLAAWQAQLDSAPRMTAVWSPEDWLAHEQQATAEQSGEWNPGTFNRQTYAAAAQGAAEGLAAEAQWTRDAVNATAGTIIPGTIRTVLSFLPWWVWLGGAIYFAGQAGWLPTIAAAGKKGVAWMRTK